MFVLTQQERFATLMVSVEVPDSARALAEKYGNTFLTLSVRAEVQGEPAKLRRTSMVQARLRGDSAELVDRVVLGDTESRELQTTMSRRLDPDSGTCPPRPEPCHVVMTVDYGWYADAELVGEIRIVPTVTALAQAVQRSKKKDLPEVEVRDGLELKRIGVSHSALPAPTVAD